MYAKCLNFLIECSLVETHAFQWGNGFHINIVFKARTQTELKWWA